MMRVRTVATLLILLVAAAPVGADRGHGGGGGRHGGGGGRHGGGGWHGHGGHRFHGGFHGPRAEIFIGSGFFWDPFWPRYYPYPYYYPYPAPYPYPVYPPPPPDDRRYARDDYEAPRAEAPEEDAERATYGLIQLRGVPDGADVDLDGRFWLKAHALDNRWLAVPEGQHTFAVRVEGNEPQTRDVEVRAGAKQVIKFGPFRKR